MREPDPLAKQSLHDELGSLLTECHTANWDAYAAQPVDAATVPNARRFIEALPPGYPLPSLGAGPDGYLTLEWYGATGEKRGQRELLGVLRGQCARSGAAPTGRRSIARGASPWKNVVQERAPSGR